MFPHIHECTLLSIKHQAECLGIFYNSVLKYANEIAWSVKYLLSGFLSFSFCQFPHSRLERTLKIYSHPPPINKSFYLN